MLKKQSQLLRRGGKISKKLSPNNKSLPDHHFKKVKVKRGLSGLGLFAGEDIKKGELIIEYIGEILTKEEADKVTNCQYLFEVSRNHTINGSPRWNIARYANHSCDGNAESDVKKKRVFVKAIKNIKEGEEIVYDYGEEFVKEYIASKGCNCSAEKHLYGLTPVSDK
jgi:SET domain-containing protein